MNCRFDWYQATLDAPPGEVAEAVAEAIPGASTIEPGRGRNGYTAGLYVRDADGQTLAAIFSGGSNGAPNAFASGDRAEPFAAVLRDRWAGVHRVTRLDSAADLHGSFAELHGPLTRLAGAKGLKFRTIVPGDPEDGATLYLGSPTSRVSARIYEKGKELRAKGHPVTEEQLGLVRLEVQLRPTQEGRLTAATLSPSQAWGATHWTRDVAVQFIGFDPDRHKTRFRLISSFEQKAGHLVDQYGDTLRELRRRTTGNLSFALVLAYLLDGEP